VSFDKEQIIVWRGKDHDENIEDNMQKALPSVHESEIAAVKNENGEHEETLSESAVGENGKGEQEEKSSDWSSNEWSESSSSDEVPDDK
jgi:hypothetical protein